MAAYISRYVSKMLVTHTIGRRRLLQRRRLRQSHNYHIFHLRFCLKALLCCRGSISYQCVAALLVRTSKTNAKSTMRLAAVRAVLQSRGTAWIDHLLRLFHHTLARTLPLVHWNLVLWCDAVLWVPHNALSMCKSRCRVPSARRALQLCRGEERRGQSNPLIQEDRPGLMSKVRQESTPWPQIRSSQLLDVPAGRSRRTLLLLASASSQVFALLYS